MKQLLPHTGLLAFIFAVILLMYGIGSAESNTPFLFSLIFMIGGIVLYIVMNRISEE